MLLEVDEASLEWRVSAQLSNDKVMINEIIAGIDPHETIRQKIFNGTVERVVAKIWNFRMLYMDESLKGYAYFKDPTMPDFSQKRWDTIVQGFFEHYTGFAEWHTKIVREVNRKGVLVGPTGRYWKFEKSQGRYGMQYDKAKIYNYPVQGTSADVVKLYLCDVMSTIRELPDVKLVNCVHDSLIFDLPKKDVDRVAEVCYVVGSKQHERLREVYDVDWVVPLGVEVSVGMSWGKMSKLEVK